MNGSGPPQGAYWANRRTTSGRQSVDDDNGVKELRSWILACAVLSLTSGVLGWKVGSSQWNSTEPKGSVATARLDPKAGAWTAVVSTPPFGTVPEPAAASITTAPSPTLPFTVLRGNNDPNQPMILIEHDGQRFIASGLTVYADYLIQLARDQVIFTYLPSAVRQTLSLPAVTAQGRDLPQAGATTYWSAYRTSSGSLKTTKALEVTSAEEEAERD